MQLSDETLEYLFQGVLAPVAEGWTPLAELQTQQLLSPARLRSILPQLQQVRGQLAAERELLDPPPEQRPLEAGFIDLPQKTLDLHRRHQEKSDLGRVLSTAQWLKQETDRVVILGSGGALAGPRALFGALCHGHHNELGSKDRLGVPRVYFAGDSTDTDATQDLLDLLERTCVDPDLREERWGLVVVNKSGDSLATAAAYRLFRAEAVRYYGSNNGKLRQYIVPMTARAGGKVRDLFLAQGFTDADILHIPDNVGCRFGVFTVAGLLPAAILGLDVRALLLGAAAMTKRFLEEPFERNPVLQFAAVNHLLSEEHGKRSRVLAVWTKKLEALGRWYEQLLAASLNRFGKGPAPTTCVLPRDLTARGQQLQDGPRTAVVNHLVVKSPKSQPFPVGMSDQNEDDLNQYARRTLPDLTRASHAGLRQALAESARPTADLVLPAVSEMTLGQVMQFLMLATVVEAKLAGINPYGRPSAAARQRYAQAVLRGMSNPKAG
ncbi:MAG TPA: glucose-6-phosphate isomerase [Gemmataceae bacterium]|jgi:glucose-6-phosphate isomerase|nr:glucose-6-phosphate isomerase [Gemmataceae bacterium]